MLKDMGTFKLKVINNIVFAILSSGVDISTPPYGAKINKNTYREISNQIDQVLK